MTVKPIDLQTHINQMHEVAKNTQERSAAAAVLQNVLDQESEEQTRLVNTKLDENKKMEKTSITHDEHGKRKRHGKRKKEEESQEEDKVLTDERMGKFIDVKK